MSIIKLGLLASLVACGVFSASAFAGPPFQTDDPDPVQYKHFEAYLFELSDGTATGGTNLEVPSFEMNWGAAPDLQLHLVLPLTFAFAPNNGPTNYGLGDIEIGAKYRLIKEGAHVPEIGIFPFVELPTGDVSRGLGIGKTWYRFPVWLQKSWGPWTTYGGGGEVIAEAPGFKNYTFAGWLLQKQITDKFILGGELYGHGSEGALATSTEGSVMFDSGAFYCITPEFQLLFSGGQAVAGQPETYSYFAFYWTWGQNKNSSSIVKFEPPDAGSNI